MNSAMKFFAVCSFIFLSLFAAQDSFAADPANENPFVKVFTNPTKIDQTAKCSPENIDAARFSNKFADKDKIKVCEGMDLFINHSRLAANNASLAVSDQMREVWNTFVESKTRFMPLSPEQERSMFAAASASGNRELYRAAVYVSAKNADSELFFYIFWHELKHVYDIKQTWERHARIPNYNLEFNGFYFASELAEAYRPKNWDPRQSGFWRDEWKNLPAEQKRALRTKAIDDFMNGSPVYADTRDRNQAQYDFTHLQ
jgi:hypothetical protein